MKIDFLYGTAWKEELTETCVFNALKAGYRGIDTANQRKHYFEEGVGKGLSRAYEDLGIARKDLFIQTKFTYASGQDHRKPYDETAPIAAQVQQSFESSLQHLGAEYLDSLILHGPSSSTGLKTFDWVAWRKLEELCDLGKVKSIGISNVNLGQLVELYEKARIKPTFVQNRCHAETKWDLKIRSFCLKNGVSYQGFSLLTANSKFLSGNTLRPAVKSICEQTHKNIQQVIFRFAQQVGMIPLTGTRSEDHMKLDLDIRDFNLTSSQLETLESIAFL